MALHLVQKQHLQLVSWAKRLMLQALGVPTVWWTANTIWVSVACRFCMPWLGLFFFGLLLLCWATIADSTTRGAVCHVSLLELVHVSCAGGVLGMLQLPRMRTPCVDARQQPSGLQQRACGASVCMCGLYYWVCSVALCRVVVQHHEKNSRCRALPLLQNFEQQIGTRPHRFYQTPTCMLVPMQ